MKQNLILLFFMLFSVTYAKDTDKEPIVIISSYNPDVRSVSENIDLFAKRITEENIKNPLKVENMNCKNLSECFEWKERITTLLAKYYVDGHKPAVVVLFGPEASSAYFSVNDSNYNETPIVVGMRSNNIVKLPDTNDVNLKTWEPEISYLDKDYKSYNIIGGIVYDYDIDTNLKLIKSLYPKVDSLLFLSDNSFGGITMRSHFVKSIKSYPNYKVEMLDGRNLSFAEVDNRLSEIRGNKAVMIGTWRIDNTDSYAIANATYAFGQSNPSLPAFSLSSVGMGHWAIGGYLPHYQAVGSIAAEAVCSYLKNGEKQGLKIAEHGYSFDYVKLKQFNLNENLLPKDSVINNKPISFFEENLYAILIVSCVFLLLFLFITYQRHELMERRKLQFQLEKRGKELEIAYDKAEKANALKTVFIANMSHEIRTPLNAIVGFAQLLTEPNIDFSADEKAEYKSYIKANSDLLLSLIEDILDISKIDTDNMKFNINKVDMCDVCRVSVASAKSNLNSSIDILVNVPSTPVYVNTDKMRIGQVVGNLLTNAKKFTDKGHITVTLTVPNNEEICVEVKDTGTGIPADKAEKVFERFAKLNNYKQGTGLGLSICKTFVEHLGGRIWLDTSYTEGACFKFTLPSK